VKTELAEREGKKGEVGNRSSIDQSDNQGVGPKSSEEEEGMGPLGLRNIIKTANPQATENKIEAILPNDRRVRIGLTSETYNRRLGSATLVGNNKGKKAS